MLFRSVCAGLAAHVHAGVCAGLAAHIHAGVCAGLAAHVHAGVCAGHVMDLRIAMTIEPVLSSTWFRTKRSFCVSIVTVGLKGRTKS